jgi:hypothetical protein
MENRELVYPVTVAIHRDVFLYMTFPFQFNVIYTLYSVIAIYDHNARSFTFFDSDADPTISLIQTTSVYPQLGPFA